MLELIAPRETHVVGGRAQLARAVDALARRLTGRAVGLVLSGGGARAFAHLGVLDELHAAGVRIDRLGGTSMGALVASFAAAGDDPDVLHRHFEHFFLDQNPTNDYGLPAFSLIRGRKTRAMLEERFGDIRIEQLTHRFYCVSCDLVGRSIVVHRTGLLRDALYASLAIPGIYPPLRDGAGRLLVDGGVLDNLPVEAMARAGEGPVIAVDVGQRGGEPARSRRPRRLGPLGRALAGSDVQLPRIGETLLRTLTVGSSDTVAAALRHADLVIAPHVEGVGMLDWKSLDRVREIGRTAARAALAAYDGADVGLR
jgi:predicted acylesterase/phospholipase RssA